MLSIFSMINVIQAHNDLIFNFCNFGTFRAYNFVFYKIFQNLVTNLFYILLQVCLMYLMTIFLDIIYIMLFRN